jgi:hypothetical protein
MRLARPLPDAPAGDRRRPLVHANVARYAIGGGMFLAIETRYAYRNHNTPCLACLKDDVWFFSC